MCVQDTKIVRGAHHPPQHFVNTCKSVSVTYTMAHSTTGCSCMSMGITHIGPHVVQGACMLFIDICHGEIPECPIHPSHALLKCPSVGLNAEMTGLCRA